jgi:hypothetical protein
MVALCAIPLKVRGTCSFEGLSALSEKDLKGPGSSECVVAMSVIPFKVRGTRSYVGLVALITRIRTFCTVCVKGVA